MGTLDPAALQKETAKDAAIPQVMRFTRVGCPQKTTTSMLKYIGNLQIS